MTSESKRARARRLGVNYSGRWGDVPRQALESPGGLRHTRALMSADPVAAVSILIRLRDSHGRS